MLVVIYHATRMLQPPQYFGKIAFDNVFGFGHAGVDFFFVLSGFIIYYVHHQDIGRPEKTQKYVWKRLRRVFPIYWIVTAVVIGMAPLHHDRPDLSLLHIATSVLLLPGADTPLVGVAWTLQYEVLFYFLFAVAIGSRLLGSKIFVVWGLCVLFGWAVGASRWGFGFFVAPIQFEFLAGIGCARLVLYGSVPRPRLTAVLGVVGFLVAGAIENAGMVRWTSTSSSAMFTVASAVIVIGLAAAERNGLIVAGRGARFVGEVSYSLYLIHIVVLGLVVFLLARTGLVHQLPAAACVLLMVVASFVGGVCLHRGVERPMMRALRRLGQQVPPQPRQALEQRRFSGQ